MADKIEVFYTGGGITLAEVDLEHDRYAVVSSEAPEFLTIYASTDGEKSYLPDDMVSCTPEEEISPALTVLYSKMKEKLKTA